MRLGKAWIVLTAGILTLTLGIGLMAYRSASASVGTQTTTTDTALTSDWGRGGRDFGMTEEDLASALGITTDELDTAMSNAKTAAIAKAVEDGLITQAQADELTSSDSTFGGRWSGWLNKNGIDYKTFLADALNITTDQLNEAILEARYAAIDRAVEAGDITAERADLLKGRLALANDATFQGSMQSAFEAAVKQAVADGVITQAQADQILAAQSNRGGWGMGEPGLFGGGGHGHHGHGSNMMEDSTDTTTVTTEEAPDN